RNVSSITFKEKSSKIFCKNLSIIVDLGETDVVIIKEIVSSKNTSDSEEIENVSGVQQSTTQAEDSSEEASEIIPNDLQPIIIINDPNLVTSIINRVL
ncbi:28574_t:CDS:2, partial [Racocetra persica]